MPDPLQLSFGLPFDEAIAAATARKVVLSGDYYGLAARTARRAATTVSGLSALDQVQAVIDSVTAAIKSGRAFGDWQKEAEGADWSLPPGRLETIFRTNVQTAYAAGHWRAFQENKARRPYLMWSAINDSRVRPAHLAMDGHIAPVDDPIWRVWHPPAGYNCRCSQISLTEAQARARGYGGQRIPVVQPDPGFTDGEPGDLEAITAAARARKLSKVNPRLRDAAEAIDAARTLAPVAQGRPVSEALNLPGGKRPMVGELQETLNIIDRLHGDGELPLIPVRISANPKRYGGYRFYKSLDKAFDIEVSQFSPHYRMTLAHEIGHFLDHLGWGGNGFSSVVAPAAQAWRKAIAASPEYQALIRLLEDVNENIRDYAVYASSAEELWARSYAQWVAIRSGDTRMLAELVEVRANPLLANQVSQWDAAAFEPIGQAIDDLFALLRWRKP